MKTTDFIVVGSGIAGLNSALMFAHYGHVLIVTKGTVTDGSTELAQGGVAAVTSRKDSFNSHIADTLRAGVFHNKKQAVQLLVKQGPRVIARLRNLGVPFDTDTSYEAAHSYPRVHHATDFTGRKIEKALISSVRKQKNITIWEHGVVAGLITSGNQCFGVQVMRNKRIEPIFSRAVVLATGGAGQLYQWTTNPTVSTGDGIALAHRTGAKIRDLEFVQFHPTALKYGKPASPEPADSADKGGSPLFLLSEALRGEGAYLVDAQGRRFMKELHKEKELAPRDVVARAVFKQQKSSDVFLDITHKESTIIKKRFPNIYAELKKRGFDLTKELIPITPAAHFMCGGIATDVYGQTSVTNLFACGEVAATGVHGANRLASNSLLEGMVFSGQIAHSISSLPKKPVSIPVKKHRYAAVAKSGKLKSTIPHLMWNHVGVVRTLQGLSEAVSELQLMQSGSELPKIINESIVEEYNMIQTALLIAQAAQRRKKSLGAHFVSDK